MLEGKRILFVCTTFPAAILTFLIHDIMVVLLHHPCYISTQIHLCSPAFTAFSNILINLYILSFKCFLLSSIHVGSSESRMDVHRAYSSAGVALELGRGVHKLSTYMRSAGVKNQLKRADAQHMLIVYYPTYLSTSIFHI